MSLKNKVVVVTGASRGIGKEIAMACAKEHATVIITARSGDELRRTAEEIQARTPSRCLPVVCDVSLAQDVQKLADAIRSLGEPLYGLICAAGVYGSIGKFADTPFEEWEKAIDINLKGTARTIHGLLPQMKRGSRIVLFSGGGQGPMSHFSSYVTSKGGIWRLTETLGAELASDGIFLNSVAPGAVNTQMLDDLLKAGPEKVGKAFYEKSLQQKEAGGESPAKAADLCLYFLSDRATGLYGKMISAVWDNYESLKDLESLSKSDQFCFRRVVNSAGGTRA